MTDVLGQVGRWAAAEAAFEGGIPLGLGGLAWYLAWKALSGPADGRPYSVLELALILGAACAITGWAGGRQLFVMGKRNPRSALLAGALVALIGAGSLRASIKSGTEAWCGDLGGAITHGVLPTGGPRQPACVLRAVPDNPYLPGTLVQPAWSGGLPPATWGWLAMVGALGGLAFRDRSLRRSQVPRKLWTELRLAPAAGAASAIGSVSEGAVQACANPTLWGQACAQLYPADQEFESGEWCVRCQQSYTRCDRELVFRVVTLFTDELDVLNGLERMDTVAWERGDPMPPDARVSGVERWVELGTLRVPDVITVAQALALLWDQIGPQLASGSDAVRDAAKLARSRYSKVAAWLWLGDPADRMTYARPSDRVVLAMGSGRLRDLVSGAGEELVLQLDIGLLPLELRMGYYRRFVDSRRGDAWQNSKTDYWIPTAPMQAEALAEGAWVPRIEGRALRSWLALERRSDTPGRGASTPLPYRPHDPNAEVVRDESGHPHIDGVPEQLPQGELDYIRVDPRFGGDDLEVARSPGDSITEWDWIDWQQLELLRKQPLVLVESPS